jgi:hypothetical protein
MKINYPQLIATLIAAVCSIVALCFQLFGVDGQGFVTAVMAALLALCVCDMHDVRVLYKAFKKRFLNELTVIITLLIIASLVVVLGLIFNNLIYVIGLIFIILMQIYLMIKIDR